MLTAQPPHSETVPTEPGQARGRVCRAPGRAAAIAAALLASAGLLLAGCHHDEAVALPVAPITPNNKVLPFLQGTVGALTTLRGYGPLLVSGYGVVVNLHGTGSSDVPAFLREWMLQQMRKEGLGSERLGTGDLKPEEILNSTNSAVVIVEGMIPPGATAGDRFDILVSALPQTQTTSLESGDLWTTNLSILGGSQRMKFSHTLALGRGSIYLHPFDGQSDEKARLDQQRQAVVIGGGVVTEDRYLALILNQPSWTRSADIGRRINERFQETLNDKDLVAIPKTESVIEIHIPRKYHGRTEEFLQLINHLYTQRAPNFEPEQAARLGEVADADQAHIGDIAVAWETLGKTALPVIRGYYNDPNIQVRLAALQAGAKLQDGLTADPLLELSANPDPKVRLRVAQLLLDLPGSILRVRRTLADLLNDRDDTVRIAAYEAMAAHNDPIVQRAVFGDDTQLRFVLDLIPSNRPLIYVAQSSYPRVVIFDVDTPLKSPSIFRLWDDQLMVRAQTPNTPASVFYQDWRDPRAQTYQIRPLVANLVILMGHKTTPDDPGAGLNLTYSRVINVLHALCAAGDIDAPLRLQESRLAVKLAELRERDDVVGRPESDVTPTPPGAPGTPGISGTPGTAGTAGTPGTADAHTPVQSGGVEVPVGPTGAVESLTPTTNPPAPPPAKP